MARARESKPILETIVPLREADISRLKVGWFGGPSQRQILEHLRQYPTLCLWDVKSGEYVLGGPWRHRDQIVTVMDSSGASKTKDLYRALIEHAAKERQRLFVIAEFGESRRPAFYKSLGMSVLEDIIVYDRALPRRMDPPAEDLRFERFKGRSAEELARLLELDHQAFPWLWWNSEEEFRDYLSAPGVSLQVGMNDEGIACYIGTTGLRNWGHLDRIAVDPRYQGRGYGRRALEQAMRTLIAAGSRRIALSTQLTNGVSRALYDSFGFRRSKRHDYRIYGRWLQDPPADEG